MSRRALDRRIHRAAAGLPSVQTIVGPGESIGNTDIGNFASYTVRPDDAGSISNNNAVVAVRTQEAEPRELQGTATSAVAVDILGTQNPGYNWPEGAQS